MSENKILKTCRIDTHLAVGVKRKAQEQKTSQGQVMRDALRQYLNNQK